MCRLAKTSEYKNKNLDQCPQANEKNKNKMARRRTKINVFGFFLYFYTYILQKQWPVVEKYRGRPKQWPLKIHLGRNRIHHCHNKQITPGFTQKNTYICRFRLHRLQLYRVVFPNITVTCTRLQVLSKHRKNHYFIVVPVRI